jgi:ribosomal-protein-alanine N-acetyltransferase
MLTRLELDELFHPPPQLETERLLLVPMRIDHARDLFEVYADPAVHGADEKPFASLEVTQAHIGGLLKSREARSCLNWALTSKDEGRIVGSVALHAIAWSHRRADVGFTLASRLWRRGLMTEALRAVIELSFSRLRLIKLCAQNTLNNDACHAFLLKLGFEQEAVLREHAFWDDRAHDLRQYGLLRSSL